MKRLWWYLIDELCSLAADNFALGNYELRRIDGLTYVFPRSDK